jgi:hypothetical protein
VDTFSAGRLPTAPDVEVIFSRKPNVAPKELFPGVKEDVFLRAAEVADARRKHNRRSERRG